MACGGASKHKIGENMVYVMDDKMKQRLDNDFTYHKPFGDQQERYVTIRDTAKTLAVTIVTLTPPSREQSVALTLLDQVVMEANAAIARNEKE
jgi:hypothetical protein